MNYILQLQSALHDRNAQLRAFDQAACLFLAFLHGPKFTGQEGGERKDWISTGDVIAWLRETQSAMLQAGDCAAVAFKIEHDKAA